MQGILCYVCITGDLENPLDDLTLKICDSTAADNLKINIIYFTIYVYFTMEKPGNIH